MFTGLKENAANVKLYTEKINWIKGPKNDGQVVNWVADYQLQFTHGCAEY